MNSDVPNKQAKKPERKNNSASNFKYSKNPPRSSKRNMISSEWHAKIDKPIMMIHPNTHSPALSATTNTNRPHAMTDRTHEERLWSSWSKHHTLGAKHEIDEYDWHKRPDERHDKNHARPDEEHDRPDNDIHDANKKTRDSTLPIRLPKHRNKQILEPQIGHEVRVHIPNLPPRKLSDMAEPAGIPPQWKINKMKNKIKENTFKYQNPHTKTELFTV
jgi:hypothetical protein